MVPRQWRIKPSVGHGAPIDPAPAAGTLAPVAFVPKVLHHVPLSVVNLTVLPLHPDLLDGLTPQRVVCVLGHPPAVVGRPQLPRPLDDVGDSSVPPGDEVLHGADPGWGEVGLDLSQALEGGAKHLLLPQKLGRAHAVPLERRVGLWREIGDGHVDGQVPPATSAFLLQPLDRLVDAHDVLVRLTGEADHEVQLDLPPSLVPGGFHAAKELLVRQTLVDDVPHALCAGLGGKREAAPLARVANDVGDVVIETVNPLAGQGKRHILVVLLLQPVFDLNAHRGQTQVVGAG
eukprot:CAMPEP_0182616094 /NCGR_PEP_ID=MMETSP1330-20130603/37125_1 /TAXON_ID=464278 /ORGANISM="Picochlorum sp., Strain RCC944" /LENGTH=288 /DNA_ID=CAMNT_0024836109 /DNA_START=30 /DNA_END=896 /DNA_ORIENTATION=+